MTLLGGLNGLQGADTFSAGRKQFNDDNCAAAPVATVGYMGPNIGSILNGSATPPSSTASAVRF
ncbi:MAG: hypothetical protein WCY19_06720 [Candidatus Gastranaerophilaceae bacterium]